MLPAEAGALQSVDDNNWRLGMLYIFAVLRQFLHTVSHFSRLTTSHILTAP
jgi:hypothetical protein